MRSSTHNFTECKLQNFQGELTFKKCFDISLVKHSYGHYKIDNFYAISRIFLKLNNIHILNQIFHLAWPKFIQSTLEQQ